MLQNASSCQNKQSRVSQFLFCCLASDFRKNTLGKQQKLILLICSYIYEYTYSLRFLGGSSGK